MISVVVSFDRKGHLENAGGREDAEYMLVEKVNKRVFKFMKTLLRPRIQVSLRIPLLLKKK